MIPFERRHIGPGAQEQQDMLKAVGVDNISTLIDRTIPAQIRLNRELNIAPALSEQEYLNHINELGAKNQVFKSFIGLGYHETIVPSPILRNVLENPGWYTAYTPYQAEIAQGRLEALLNFQTMVIELTGMDIANASLLDEATAAAEAMIMFYNSRSRADIQAGRNKFFIDAAALPQSIDVMTGRALNLGIELVYGDASTFEPDAAFFGVFVQYPNAKGAIQDWSSAIAAWKAAGIQVAVGADIMSLVLLKSPGSMGADVVLGCAQRALVCQWATVARMPHSLPPKKTTNATCQGASSGFLKTPTTTKLCAWHSKPANNTSSAIKPLQIFVQPKLYLLLWLLCMLFIMAQLALQLLLAISITWLAKQLLV